VLGEYFRTMRVPPDRRTELHGRGPVVGSARGDHQRDARAEQLFKSENPLGQRNLLRQGARLGTSHLAGRSSESLAPSIKEAWRSRARAEGVRADAGRNWTRRDVGSVCPDRPGAAGIRSAASVGSVRLVVRGLDSLLALSNIQSMTEVHRDATSRQRFTSMLVLVFALTGVFLAVRWRLRDPRSAPCRRGETGNGNSHGAGRTAGPQVRWLVVRHGASLLGGGIAAGVARRAPDDPLARHACSMRSRSPIPSHTRRWRAHRHRGNCRRPGSQRAGQVRPTPALTLRAE